MQLPDEKNTSKARRRTGLVLILAAALLAGRAAPGYAETDADREYKVKAAFILNFIKFVDGGRFGPVDLANTDPASAEPNGPITVGVFGKPPSTSAFAELTGKQVRERSVVVRSFKGLEELKDKDGKIPEQHPEIEAIRKCHVLFVCPGEKPHFSGILADLRRDNVLVVADVPGFLEIGGMVNFVIVDNKVRFEINLAAAARAKLQVRSSLLRLAIRVVEHDQLEGRDGGGN